MFKNILKLSSNEKQLIVKSWEWLAIGKQAGWIKKSNSDLLYEIEDRLKNTKIRDNTISPLVPLLRKKVRDLIKNLDEGLIEVPSDFAANLKEHIDQIIENRKTNVDDLAKEVIISIQDLEKFYLGETEPRKHNSTYPGQLPLPSPYFYDRTIQDIKKQRGDVKNIKNTGWEEYMNKEDVQ